MFDIEELKEAKKAQRMTLDELSARSGIAKRTLEDIFRGATKNPRIDTMRAIERALGLDAPAEPQTDNELLALLQQMTEEEIIELTNYVDFIISKRK